MNILLIGNGFDLAHRLPTRYTDFLMFCKMILRFIEINDIEEFIPVDGGAVDVKEWINNDNEISFIVFEELCEIFCKECSTKLPERDRNVYMGIFDHLFTPTFYKENADYKLIKEILYLIYKNFWIEYFLDNPMYQKENWIDFENEISRMIQSLDKDMESLNGRFDIDDIVHELSNESLNLRYSQYIAAVKPKKLSYVDLSKGVTFKKIRNDLLRDWNKLIRAFEIYLTEYVEKLDINEISPDIELLGIDYLLSFNYTNTYLKQYKNLSADYSNKENWLDYIHGKADIKNTLDSNNMVLGIDEYFKKKKRNKRVDFIAFKKFYQRIHKGTGCKYKEWLDEIIKENNKYKNLVQRHESFIEEYEEYGDERLETEVDLVKLKTEHPRHNLYVFGHSLDVTDKDILKELILTDYVYTTIYYRNLDQKGQQIANLVKVIGQDELIRRTGGGSARTIEFKLQKPMVDKEFSNN